MLHVRRGTFARMLRGHGEEELSERALSVTDDELKRIGELGECYAFSKRAMATGGSMGGARALSMATIDVLEGHSARSALAPQRGRARDGVVRPIRRRVRHRPRAATRLPRRAAAPSTRLTWPQSRAQPSPRLLLARRSGGRGPSCAYRRASALGLAMSEAAARPVGVERSIARFVPLDDRSLASGWAGR